MRDLAGGGHPADQALRIVAPLNHPDELEDLIQAGADEIYCGVLPPSWSDRYGAWDCLSRRQGTVANLPSVEKLLTVASAAARLGVGASLTLNVRYTSEQLPSVLDLAQAWEQSGGAAVIVSSPALLLGLRRRSSRLRRHISLLANVMNGSAAAFFRDLGAERVILPRDLTPREMADVVSQEPNLEYEAMALNEKCRFMDGLCGFYHGTTFPAGAASRFDYQHVGSRRVPTVYAQDLNYAGHGCQVAFADERGGPVAQETRDDLRTPACAACRLSSLRPAGVRFLKIGGRGLPRPFKRRCVAYLRQAVDLAGRGARRRELRALYRETFGRDCGPSSCYYDGVRPRQG